MEMTGCKLKFTKNYVINVILLILTWGGMLRRSFNADTISHMVAEDHDVASNLECGRYLCGLIDFLLGKMGVSTTTHTGITVLAGLLFMAAALCLIQEMYKKHMNIKNVLEEYAYLAVTGLVFVNVLAAELMMFSECTAYFGAAYFMAAWGARFYNSKRYIQAAACIAVSCMFYQTGVVFCAILISLNIFFEYNGKICKKSIMQEVFCVIMTFGIGLINMMSVKVLVWTGVLSEFGKNSQIGNVLDKVKKAMQISVSLYWDSMELLPSAGIPLLFTLIIMSSFLWVYLKEKKIQPVFYYILLQIGMMILMYGIPFLQKDFYTPPRMTFIFYLIQAAGAMIAFSYARGRWKRILCYVYILYLFIQIYFAQIIVTNHFVSNTLDELYATLVYERITAYEEETGIMVNKLAVEKDIDAKVSYDEVHYKCYSINERALGMVNYSLMEVVTERKFEPVTMDPTIYQSCFEGKNWDYFNLSEQLIIEGDTAYWIIF